MAVPPSCTVTLLMLNVDGVTGGSAAIVAVPAPPPDAIVASTGNERLTVKVSATSLGGCPTTTGSVRIGTSMVCVATLAGKDSVPDTAV